MKRARALAIAVTVILFAEVHLASAIEEQNDGSCSWSEQDRQSRPDITCQKLTEKLFLGLRGAKKENVQQTMKALGKRINQDTLRFISMYLDEDDEGGSGSVNFEFANDKVIVITALVDTSERPNLKFVWNGKTGFMCSDLQGFGNACN